MSETSEKDRKYSAGRKGFMIVLQQGALIVLVTGLFILNAYSGYRTDGLKMLNNSGFVQSRIFSEIYEADAKRAASYILQRENFETEGKYDADKNVDIRDYYDSKTITGENKNGLCYTLDELLDWSNSIRDADDMGNQQIRVCEKPDGSYTYYTQTQYIDMIEAGKIYLYNQETDTYMLLTDTNNNLAKSSGYAEGNTDVKVVPEGDSSLSSLESQGACVYLDTWNLNIIAERYAPEGAANLVELANNDSRINGNLEKVSNELKSVLSSFGSDVANYKWCKESLAEGNSNFIYVVTDRETKQVYSNMDQYADYSRLTGTRTELENKGQYIIMEDTLANSYTNSTVSLQELSQTLRASLDSSRYSCYFSVDTAFTIHDTYYDTMRSYQRYAPWFGMIVALTCVSAVVILVTTFWLTLAAGRRSRFSEVRTAGFDKLPLELTGAMTLAPSIWIISELLSRSKYYYSASAASASVTTVNSVLTGYMDPSLLFSSGSLATQSVGVLIIGMLMLTLYLTIIRRIKAGILWQRTFLCFIIKGIRSIYVNRKVTTKTVLIFIVFLSFNLIAFTSRILFVIVCALTLDVIVFYYLVRGSIGRQRIMEGITAIAGGRLDYVINTTGMNGGNLKIAEAINHLGEGMQKALDESMKNERLKTDLITNVSHDIKTPLTTIISYIGILKRANPDDPKRQEYIEILDRQSQRLKHLTEDLIEASKISSGNVEISLMVLDFTELLNQVIGECEEKFKAYELKLVVTLPDQPLEIMADGRQLFRVLENLFTNAAKYAMPGTRVYVDLSSEDDRAIFSLKNVSRQQLNISSEELTERFIRGDLSRSTEGSGLGLSIAKSLTELQKGTFEIYLDGDLFRVTVSFPVWKKQL